MTMKRSRLYIGAALALGCLTMIAAGKKDPVLMKVNGKPVTLSEFEYMYHKNNQQQVAQQPLEKYLDMFTTYKLKVADAVAEGIDTTEAFTKEYNGYRNELAMPFLRDTAAEESMRKAIYEHMKTNVLASHIMLPLGKDIDENNRFEARLDSIRNLALAGQPFDSLALKNSVDPSVRRNNGSMGYVSVGRFPYQFEDACYETPVGEISKPFRTDYGWHIVKVYGTRPDAGEVLVKHILRLYPQGADETAKAKVKARMDSIYTLLKGGADFSELAKKESEDPGSARQGGQLPYFGRGRMVPQFEKVSFELKNGELSEPFETQYGIHIVQKIDSRQIGSYAETRDQLTGYVQQRGNVAMDAKVEQLEKQYKLKINDKTVESLKKMAVTDSINDTYKAKIASMNDELFRIGSKKYPVSSLSQKLEPLKRVGGSQAAFVIDTRVKELARETVIEMEKENLEHNNAEFGNLVREYRDGMLLFEVSNRKVWEKASTDNDGLAKYFEANRTKYRWDSPKYKGYLVETTGDSISKLAKATIATADRDSVIAELRKAYGKDLKITRVLTAKGENAKVDSEVFGTAKVTAAEKDRYKDYFVFGGKLIAKPEDVNDVRGLVVADYQDYLEKQWVEQLKQQYPVEIDRKVLKQVK